MKKRHKIINLIHPDAAKTPYGWAFENFYDPQEHLKALSNKTGDATAIGGEEFKPFDNLTTRWIKTSKLGQLLWVIHIDNDGKENSQWKLTNSMLIKLHMDQSLRESIKHHKWRWFQKLTNDKLNNMNERFGPYNDDHFNKMIFMKLLR